jgi:hypothetical protein
MNPTINNLVCVHTFQIHLYPVKEGDIASQMAGYPRAAKKEFEK